MTLNTLWVFPKPYSLWLILLLHQIISRTDKGSVKSVNWHTFVFTKVVISDSKVLISVSGTLWQLILNDHWFWNLAFGVFLKSRANLTNLKSFSKTVLPWKDNRGTKKSLRNCIYGQSKSTHLYSIPSF